MAYTLKGTGLATKLVFCIAVDDDGTTVKEFVSSTVNSTKVVDTAVSVGSSTWKGTTRGWFQTKNGQSPKDAQYDFEGVTFVTNLPTAAMTSGAGLSIFAACAGASAGTGDGAIAWMSSTDRLRRSATNKLEWYLSSGVRGGASTTSLPTDGTTKFSFAASYLDNVTTAFYYGLESGNLGADGGANPSNFGSSTTWQQIGGADGQGSAPGKWHIICAFNEDLSETDFDSLHDDWFGTLFDAPPAPPAAPTGVNVGSVTTNSATINWIGVSGETGYDVQIAPDPFTSWTTVSGSPTAADVSSLPTGATLTPNTLYKPRVRSKGVGGDSAWTEMATSFRTVASVKVRPASDVTAGAWTSNAGGALYAAVDESSASDTDFITTSSASTFEVALGAVTDPQVGFGHTIRYRFRSPTNDTFTIRLVQGTTIIATDPTPRSPGGTFTTYEWTITEAEANAISDYANLRIRGTVS